MKSINKKHQKKLSGFTMIELIFVIIILGILSAVAIPKFMGAKATSELELYQQTWNIYKEENPYSAVTIESLLETGAIAMTLESLPVIGVRSAVLYLSKQASKQEYPLIKTKQLAIYITRPAYEAYLMKNAKLTFFNSKKIMQRDSIFFKNKDNIARMKLGKAPIGKDGQPIELHHLRQKEDFIIIEVLGNKEHKKYSNLLHDSAKGTEIQRSIFNTFRQSYWKERVKRI